MDCLRVIVNPQFSGFEENHRTVMIDSTSLVIEQTKRKRCFVGMLRLGLAFVNGLHTAGTWLKHCFSERLRTSDKETELKNVFFTKNCP